MATTYLTKTYSGDGNRKKGTISVWCKFSDSAASADSTIFGCGNISNDSDCTFLSVNGNGFGSVSTRQIIFALRISGGTVYKAVSNALLRDINGWYNIVVRWDTTLGTPNCDIYLNGEEVSYSSNNWSSVSTDTNTYIGSTAYPHYIGRGAYCDAMKNNYMDGCMSHLHYCDGYYYDASTFGSTDATTGEWKINTNPTVTYGTNGFFLFKNNAAVTDQSGQGNNFTLDAGTLTKTEDNPSDVFATFNPILAMNGTMSLANGNTQATTASNYAALASNSYFSTLGMTKGKFYSEFKAVTTPAANALIGVGFDLSSAQQGTTANQYNLSYTNLGFSYNSVGSIGNDGDGWTSTGYDSYTANDIIGVAIDLDNNKLYVSKNGTWQNSANPSSGTGGFSITADKEYFFAVSDNASAEVYVYAANFGNGYFGTSAVSSAGTNASNIGIFEYDVPTGYTALSTKGLNL